MVALKQRSEAVIVFTPLCFSCKLNIAVSNLNRAHRVKIGLVVALKLQSYTSTNHNERQIKVIYTCRINSTFRSYRKFVRGSAAKMRETRHETKLSRSKTNGNVTALIHHR